MAETQGLYEFHFKVDNTLKTDLMVLPKKDGARSLSGLIRTILAFLSEKMDAEHYFGKERESRYEYVHNDLDVERESVHVYLTKQLYGKLKMMHHDLNFYSIAQLLRWLLRFYVGLVRVYGADFEVKLQELIKKWKKKNISRQFPKNAVRQLSSLIYEKQAKLSLLNVYNDSFFPIMIYRL
jgi:hypothetical protein